MNDRNPLNLPEIRLYVAEFLCRNDLGNCMSVCKAWKETFYPLFWKHIHICNHGSSISIHGTSINIHSKPKDQFMISLNSLLNHSMYIHSLDFKTVYLTRYISVFPNLKSLAVASITPINFPITLKMNSVEVFIRFNPTIRKLSISGLDGFLTTDLWNTVSKLPHLTDLNLKAATIAKNDFNAFWDLCTTLETLSLDSTTILCDYGQNLISQRVFPKLQTLHFIAVNALDINEQIKIVHQCPILKDWSWHSVFGLLTNSSLDLLKDGIEKGRWPQLESLSLGIQFSSEMLSRIVNHMKRITKLNIFQNNFHPTFLESLRPHYNTLVELTLFDYTTGSDRSLSGVFSLIPNLKTLKVGRVNAEDIANGAPWVCRSLRTLRTCFIFNKDNQHYQPLIFERLSQLVYLRVLEIGGWVSMDTIPFGEALDFRVENGLSKLSTLKNLKELSLEMTTQKLEVVDIEWMFKNWKMLEEIRGKLNHDPAVYFILKAILRSSKVGGRTIKTTES